MEKDDILTLNNDDLELIARLVSAAINAYGRTKDTTTFELVHDQFDRLILLGSKIQSIRDLMQGEADNIAAELGNDHADAYD